MTHRLLKLLLSLGFFSLLCWGITTYTCLLECSSGSLDGVRYALFFKSSSIKRGDIVCIQGYKPLYVGEELFIKRILGMPGDKIERNKTKIRIKSQELHLQSNLPLLSQTREGKPLTPIEDSFVPMGYVFVGGDHPRSFDSRYQEFGLVPLNKVWGKAIAVFSTQYPVFRWIFSTFGLENKGEK